MQLQHFFSIPSPFARRWQLCVGNQSHYNKLVNFNEYLTTQHKWVWGQYIERVQELRRTTGCPLPHIAWAYSQEQHKPKCDCRGILSWVSDYFSWFKCHSATHTLIYCLLQCTDDNICNESSSIIQLPGSSAPFPSPRCTAMEVIFLHLFTFHSLSVHRLILLYHKLCSLLICLCS